MAITTLNLSASMPSFTRIDAVPQGEGQRRGKRGLRFQLEARSGKGLVRLAVYLADLQRKG